jgi:hypothetical protein
MATLWCGRCAVSDLQVFANGILTDPDGWSHVTISSRPMTNRRLCPSCTNVIRRALAGAPLAVAS